MTGNILILGALLVAVAGIIVLALIKRGPALSAAAIVILLGGLLLREVALGSYQRSTGVPVEVTEELLPEFYRGSDDMAGFALLSAIFVFLVIIVTVVSAVQIRDARVRLYTVGALGASLLVRDLSIGMYAYYLFGQNPQVAGQVNAYQLGAREILEFYMWTSPYLLLTAGIVVLLAAKGFRRLSPT